MQRLLITHQVRLIPALIAFVLAAIAPPARAMVAVPRDFPELVARAEQIVAGTVTTVAEEQDAAGSPWTLVTLSDLTVLKGEADTTLTLRFYGGTTSAGTVRIPDMPSFTPGERGLLFIAGNGRDVCPLVGLWQGRFRLRVDAGGTEIVEDNDYQPVVARNGRRLLRAAADAPTAAPAAAAAATGTAAAAATGTAAATASGTAAATASGTAAATASGTAAMTFDAMRQLIADELAHPTGTATPAP